MMEAKYIKSASQTLRPNLSCVGVHHFPNVESVFAATAILSYGGLNAISSRLRKNRKAVLSLFPRFYDASAFVGVLTVFQARC